ELVPLDPAQVLRAEYVAAEADLAEGEEDAAVLLRRAGRAWRRLAAADALERVRAAHRLRPAREVVGVAGDLSHRAAERVRGLHPETAGTRVLALQTEFAARLEQIGPAAGEGAEDRLGPNHLLRRLERKLDDVRRQLGRVGRATPVLRQVFGVDVERADVHRRHLVTVQLLRNLAVLVEGGHLHVGVALGVVADRGAVAAQLGLDQPDLAARGRRGRPRDPLLDRLADVADRL